MLVFLWILQGHLSPRSGPMFGLDPLFQKSTPLLGHDTQKIITAENLQKRGIAGPSRCALCMASEESIQHLFFECPFTLKIWDLMITSLQSKFHPPSNWNDMFIHWKQIYAGNFNKKLIFASLWRQTPKFICWGIWLARNKAIFQNKSLPPNGFMHNLVASFQKFSLSIE
jgi:hypothetical protein